MSPSKLSDLAFLNRIVIELLRVESRSAEDVAIGFYELHQRLDVMDDESAMQAAEFLAHYLSNAKFKFPFWNEWAESLETAMEEEGDENAERRFLSHLLGTC